MVASDCIISYYTFMPSIFTQIVVRDIRSKAPVHLLIIPKAETKNFYETPFEILDLLNRTTKLVVEMLGIEDHFRIVVNNGYGQEIDHVHYHLLSDRGAEKLSYTETGSQK